MCANKGNVNKLTVFLMKILTTFRETFCLLTDSHWMVWLSVTCCDRNTYESSNTLYPSFILHMKIVIAFVVCLLRVSDSLFVVWTLGQITAQFWSSNKSLWVSHFVFFVVVRMSTPEMDWFLPFVKMLSQIVLGRHL